MIVELHFGDCLDVLPTLADASVAAVFADPPYAATRNSWDVAIPLDRLWPQLERVSRGPIVLTAMQPFSSLLVTSRLSRFRHEWIWRKNKVSGHLNANRGPLRDHEAVLVFCDRQPPYNPQMTAGHRPGNFARRRTHSINYGVQAETVYGGQTTRFPRSVQDFDVVNNDDPSRCHPTQKPVALFEYLIRTYTQPGDIVLDFCAGSGTTGLAAQRAGRGFIGIESEPIHFANAGRRLGLTDTIGVFG